MSLSEDIYGIPESDPELYASRDMSTIAQRWNSKAARWDADLEQESCHLNDDGAYRRFIALGKQLVLDRQKLCSTGCLVDLGCGTGAVLAEFSMHFNTSIGIDISGEMLKIAASKNLRNAEWFLDDVFGGAWSERRHAAVLSRGILLSHYGGELARLLISHAVKALSPGGFALFDFLSCEKSETTKILAPNKVHFHPDWLIDQAKHLGSGGAIVAGSPNDRVRYLILQD